jgi:large subunit ribosomal protein L7/L12
MIEKLEKIIDQLKNLTLLEAAELVKEIETTFGIDTSIPLSNPTIISPVAMTSAAPGESSPAVEEKNLFELTLSQVPADKKIAILKVVRTITGLGLKESKDIVENVPKVLKEGLTQEDSAKFKKELEDAGATVVIK